MAGLEDVSIALEYIQDMLPLQNSIADNTKTVQAYVTASPQSSGPSALSAAWFVELFNNYIIAPLKETFGDMLSGIGDAITRAWESATRWLGSIIEGIKTGLRDVWNGLLRAIDYIEGLAQTIWDKASGILEWLGEKIAAVARELWEAVKTIFQPVLDILSRAWDDLTEWFREIKTWVETLAKSIWDWLAETIAAWGKWLSELADTIGDWIADTVKLLIAWAVDQAKAISEWIITTVAEIAEVINNVIASTQEMIARITDTIGDVLDDLLKQLRTTLDFSLGEQGGTLSDAMREVYEAQLAMIGGGR